MTDFRKVTDGFSVAPQIAIGDLARAAEAAVSPHAGRNWYSPVTTI